MSIRLKIILIIVPLFVCVLILTSSISALTTKSGLTNLAIQGASFKANQLEQYIDEQWNLLVENNLSEQAQYIESFDKQLSEYAATLVTGAGEAIFAYDMNVYEPTFSTVETEEVDAESVAQDKKVSEEELRVFSDLIDKQGPEGQRPQRAWIDGDFILGGTDYVGYYFIFETRKEVIIVATSAKEFSRPVREIIYITGILILLSILISTIIILLFSKSLVNPLRSMIKSMHQIIETNSFDSRVEVKYRDEIGELSQTFNVMIEELDRAYQQIKQYAFSAVVAKKNESKIRNIFQKYVPVNVINSLFKDPSRLLTGENRELSLLFTDIRGFTTISEIYTPEKLVQVLNEYFGRLVEVITQHEGIIDKYMGDAIMAFFGAPVELENSPLAAVTSAMEMIVELDKFNADLKKKNLPEFITGIGINYGHVTVGNIGSDKKMDYTAIGDAVNLGSRLEGLTKKYKQTVIFSDSVYKSVYDVVPSRIVDIVRVKGKTTGEKIYTSTPYITDQLLEAYAIHNDAIAQHWGRDFKTAKQEFQKVKNLLKNDFLADMYIDVCTQYIDKAPPKDWDGTFIMTTK